MGKKKYVITVIVSLIVLLSAVYAYTSSISISGKSENGMWKYTYKKNLDASEPSGWQGRIKQLDKQEVEVEKLEFKDNGKTIADTDIFNEGRDIDGSVTTFHPFSTEFLLGDGPIKGHLYKVVVTWKKDGIVHMDTIDLK
ncbi:hypothetical protein [Niallia taxi]|uniref:hypothetical protein n=1 Tax=Niallia taxi TaxID=2499688 RepID=UPI002E1B39C9|nr:hypothetical protein [Niallia taxi]